MDKLKSKIAGSVIGFAIGDSMGATTEFLHPHQIKAKYGKVDDLIGGGWLMTEPGEVTDDTQMTICVMDAIMKAYEIKDIDPYGFTYLSFSRFCKENFIKWFDSKPKDIGNLCERGILSLKRGIEINHNKNALGNGSLMRALPFALMGTEFEEWNISQGSLTHNNNKCSRVILDYHRMIQSYLYDKPFTPRKDLNMGLLDPTGHIWNTYSNSIYWANKKSFKKTIIGAVNNGGDSDTIAAIAGSISGVKYGIEDIPREWIDKLDKNVKLFLKSFINFVYTYLQV